MYIGTVLTDIDIILCTSNFVYKLIVYSQMYRVYVTVFRPSSMSRNVMSDLTSRAYIIILLIWSGKLFISTSHNIGSIMCYLQNEYIAISHNECLFAMITFYNREIHHI